LINQLKKCIMKRSILISLVVIFASIIFASCKQKKSSDIIIQEQSEQQMIEANNQLGLPAIVNYQEKKNMKWIYELCDQENLICYAYLWNEYNGSMVLMGECIGYGIPYSTQYSNPEKIIQTYVYGTGYENVVIPQAEPNGLFKPVGLSATWLIMIDPDTKKPRPVYVEPQIIVSPFKLQ